MIPIHTIYVEGLWHLLTASYHANSLFARIHGLIVLGARAVGAQLCSRTIESSAIGTFSSYLVR